MQYDVIYADPPWPYDNEQDFRAARGSAPYPKLTMQEIHDLPVARVAKEDALLLLWTTMPKLEYAFGVMSAWGFEYRTCAFVWIKLNPKGSIVTDLARRVILEGGIYSGLGSWVNGNVELCLLAKRGSPKRAAKDVKQVLFAPVGKHSTKPTEAYDRIERLTGPVSRLELFARIRYNESWTATGLEYDNTDVRDFLRREGDDGQ